MLSPKEQSSSLAIIDCKEAYRLVGLEYDPKVWVCYNEELNNRQLCPYASIDCCVSSELPNQF